LLDNKKKTKVIPRQCREKKCSYKGDFIAIISNDFMQDNHKTVSKIGRLPIMVRSLKCNLNNLRSSQLIELDEEELEIGSYFIVNGIEKVIRLIIVPKRNTIQVISRLSNAERGNLCTTLSCSFRSVDRVQNSKTLHLHYLTSGNIQARIIIQRQEFFIPVIILLKALMDISDKQLIDVFTRCNPKDKFLRQRAMNMIKDAHDLCDISDRKNILLFLGKVFRLAINVNTSDNIKIAEIFLSEFLFVHLGSDNKSKWDLMSFMVHRLLSVQRGISREDNPDSIDSQEFLLPGHLYLIYMKERLENSIYRYSVDINKKRGKLLKKDKFNFKKLETAFNSVSIGIEKLVSCGNIHSEFKEELSQLTGLSVSVERLNFGRFISYLRSVHRGKFLSEIRGTSGRKLSPQSWGFICPVHTPDGTPCGILNHLSSSVVVSLCNPIEKIYLQKYLYRNGLKKNYTNTKLSLTPIILDGKLLGFGTDCFLRWLTDKLRSEKVSRMGKIPVAVEIVYITHSHSKTNISGCFIFSEESRLLRPIFWNKIDKNKKKLNFRRNKYINLSVQQELEMVGTFEQSFLNIRNLEADDDEKIENCYYSHIEIETGNILSIIAGMTPFSDLNQSPRNMYQCQMSKQSVGVPFYTFWRRDDIKSNFLLTPQLPICRNKAVQDGLNLDAFPNGINAVVSILSYTGFDMEDAMVINKSSIDRGFSTSTARNISNFEIKNELFNKKRNSISEEKKYPKDGLTDMGKHIFRGDLIYLKEDTNQTGKQKRISICYNGQEKAIVDKIKLISDKNAIDKNIRSCIKLRCRRRPIIGDKFASRHGQKGIFSIDYPASDLPFSELGIIPDIIFNPHGFPSRMTIGVILETLAGKTGSLNGVFHDSSSFRLSKKYLGLYQFSENLRKLGFQYFGNEIFYSGYTGEPLLVGVLTGIIQYQRLRHMVSDKFQVSEIGPRNIMTRQPIKGRKSGGAIRFGEMERDVLLGHGSVFLLHDRLQLASDLHSVKINIKTGSIFDLKSLTKKSDNTTSKICVGKTTFLPYVTKFLITELSVMNIKTILYQADS
jgi:DNA-directed RNA polymerase I subunit RPA2